MNNLFNFMLLLAFPNLVFAHDLGLIHLHGTEFVLCMMMVLLIYLRTRKVLNVRRIKND
tara:strand:- start:227 stop:403 length:177 start_codon:yes stop_codon:yes gene_type:complete